MNKQLAIWGTIILGAAFVIAGLVVAYLGWHTYDHITEQLKTENLTVQDPAILLTYEGARAPEGVEVPEVVIDTAQEADDQANVIRTHVMGITGGKTYTEMDREDPARATFVTGLTLETSLHLAHTGLELSQFVMGVGIAFVGFGAYTLVIGLPLVRKIVSLK